MNQDGALDLVAAGADSAAMLLAETKDGVSPLPAFSLLTKSDAPTALDAMKLRLSLLSQQQGKIGSIKSRLSTDVSILSIQSENYHSASSQILDADVASESSRLVRTGILQRAASAVLSHANQQPALAIKLLRG